MYYKRKKNNMIGFYVAMGVCLLAVGIAAVASYSNVEKLPSVSESASSDNISASSPIITAKEPETSEENENTFETSSNDESHTVVNHIDMTTSETPSSSASSEASLSVAEENTNPEIPPSENSIIAEDTLAVWTSQFSLSMPVGGDIIKEFSNNELVYSETMRDYRVHNGIDISASRGDTVHAISFGTVLEVRQDDLLGNMVVIDHSGFKTSYCGLGSTILVKVGETVKQGQDIGSVLEVPCEIIDQAHIHIEVQKNGSYIDPLSLLP